MSEVNPRYRLVVDKKVAGDLSRVREEDPDAFDELQVFFEDLQGDESWCASIADPHYTDHQIEEVKAFRYLVQERKNAYIVKFFAVKDWRVITAADHRAKKIAILGVMHRDQDYENDSAFMERLKASYESLGLANF